MSTDNSSKTNGLTYAQAGVDIEAGNRLVDAIKPLARSTMRAGADSELGGFGGLFDLKATGFNDPILVAANDGVGTKIKIAIETGRHDTIGIDLVAMCVNDLIVQGAEPLFFLDYFASGKLDVNVAENVIAGIAEGCRQAGAALIGGETAEMPGMYADGDYDLAGFSVGAVEREQILPHMRQIEEGHKIIGLASSGVHSNGYSLVRKLVETLGLNWEDAAPFDTDRTLADAFLAPTKIYVKPVLSLLKSVKDVAAIAHITGGGLVENLPRVLPEGLTASINLDALAVPSVFKWIAKNGGIEDLEMLRTLNCGCGLVIVLPETSTDEAISILKGAGETPFILGELVERGQKQPVEFNGILQI